jgi:hypothetical protein
MKIAEPMLHLAGCNPNRQPEGGVLRLIDVFVVLEPGTRTPEPGLYRTTILVNGATYAWSATNPPTNAASTRL